MPDERGKSSVRMLWLQPGMFEPPCCFCVALYTALEDPWKAAADSSPTTGLIPLGEHGITNFRFNGVSHSMLE